MSVDPKPLPWKSGKTASEWMAAVRPSCLFPNVGLDGSSVGRAMSASVTVMLVVLVATMWPKRTDLRSGAPL